MCAYMRMCLLECVHACVHIHTYMHGCSDVVFCRFKCLIVHNFYVVNKHTPPHTLTRWLTLINVRMLITFYITVNMFTWLACDCTQILDIENPVLLFLWKYLLFLQTFCSYFAVTFAAFSASATFFNAFCLALFSANFLSGDYQHSRITLLPFRCVLFHR